MNVRAPLIVISSVVALLAGCGAPPPAHLPPVTSATIAVRYSRFGPGVVAVRAGVPVTFTLRNEDPIEHEWLVGTAASHAAHRNGTDPVHESRPDEVTLPPYVTRVTTLTFDRPGDYL